MGLTWAGTVPALLAMILDWLGVASLFLRRYLLGDFWPILVLPGLFLTYLRGRPKQFVAIGVVFLSLLMNAHWAPQRWKVGRLTPSRREAWRRAVDQVRKVDPNGELPLFLVPGLIESRRLASDPDPLLREYLASPISTLYKVPHAAKDVIPLSSVTPAAPSAEIVEQVARRGGALWLIRISPQHADAWRRYALQLRQELKSQSQDEWLLREFVKPGIVILELRCAVR